MNRSELQHLLYTVDDYFNDETLIVDDVQEDHVSIQPTNQYVFYDIVDWDRIRAIVRVVFEQGTQDKVWIGNYLYERQKMMSRA